MKPVIFLLILGIISCKTTTDVLDMYYNSEDDLTDKCTLDYCDDYSYRLPVIPGDTIDVEVKIEKDMQNAFDGIVDAYTHKPSDEEILNREGGTELQKVSDGMYNEGNYMVYYKTFVVPDDCNYFGIHAKKISEGIYIYSYLHVRVTLFNYKYSLITNVTYDKNYLFDTSIFRASTIIPNPYNIYYRLKVTDDTMKIQLLTKNIYDKTSAFKVELCEYDHTPTSPEIYYGNGAIKCFSDLENISQEELLHIYSFTPENGISWISICVKNNVDDLSYLNTYIYIESPEPTSSPQPEPTSSPIPAGSKINNLSKYLLFLLLLILV